MPGRLKAKKINPVEWRQALADAYEDVAAAAKERDKGRERAALAVKYLRFPQEDDDG